MPPSSALMTLYSGGRDTSPTSPSRAASPFKLNVKGVSVVRLLDPENTDPNNNLNMDAKVTGPDFASTSSITHNAPFLEMEEDENDYEDVVLDTIPLDESESGEKDLLLGAAAAAVPSNQDGLVEEEKKEEIENDLSGFISRVHSSSPRIQFLSSSFHSRDNNEVGITCGKRSRSSRRVSFGNPLDQEGIDLDERRPRKKSLVRVRGIIHLSEYTAEERQAVWYTYTDLKSFKKERKETARQIDNGLLSLPLAYIPPPHTSEQREKSDIYVDSTSFSKPVVYCSRGVENCTETISRIRYGHILNGLRAVMNTQENHYYQQQKMIRMSSSEKDEFAALASFLGGGERVRPSRKSWLLQGTIAGDSKRSNSDSRQKVPYDGMCCPYELAAAYKPSSVASLDIARKRALGDERDAAFHYAQDQENKHQAAGTIQQNPSSEAQIPSNGDRTLADTVLKQQQEKDENNDIDFEKYRQRRIEARREAIRKRTIDI